MFRRFSLACLIAALSTFFIAPTFAQEWTRFRGPNGTGLSDAEAIPTKFSEKDYNWKVKLPGVGHSQPVIWGDKIFLTSALEKGAQRLVLCVNAADGSTAWKYELPSKTHGKHRLNSYASATPAVDDKMVYVAFAHENQYLVIALDHSGDVKWRADLGEFTSRHGQALSPIVVDDLVIIGKEQGRDSKQGAKSFIAAIDKKLGTVRWMSARGTKYVSYSTPCFYKAKDGSPRLICSSTADGLTAVDARNGKKIWWNDCFKLRTVSSSVMAGDLAFGTCGSGGGGNYLVAVRIGGEGDVSGTHEVYRVKQSAPYVPTPIVKGDRLFTFSDRGGIASCIEASTGKLIWRERAIPGATISGSPICVQDRIYCVTHDGTVVVLAASDEFKVLAKNELGEQSRCTPAVSGGRMYLRTFNEQEDCTHLISIGGKKVAKN